MDAGAPPSVDELDVLTRLRERMLGRSDEGRIIGRYRLVRPLGQGGMGEVWLAEDPRLGRRVALKLLHRGGGQEASQGRARLLREAQAIAQITHPNVVSVFDCGTVTTDGVPRAYIAMELVDGTGLDVWLAAQPRTQDAILAVFVDAGRGLAAAHAAGQIHRDFKPANVVVTTDGRAKVLDFGLVLHDADSQVSHNALVDVPTQRETASVDTRLTEPGLVMGTPRYMAPEQHTGATVTAASDQFAFCCALLEALQGEPPFVGNTHVDLGRAKMEGRVRRSGARPVPSWLRAVVERELDPVPSRRWPSMAALLRRLEHRSSGRPTVIVAGIAGLAVVGFIAMPERERCHASSWTSDRAAELERRLVAPDSDVREQEHAHRVALRVDDYGTRIAAHRQATCEAQSDATIDETAFERRMSCLAERSSELASAMHVLETGDVVAGGRADGILGTLRDPDACMDDARADAAIDRPDDDRVALAVDLVRGRIAMARALRYAGKDRDARAELDAARADLADIDHPPVLAELELEAGRLAADMNESTAIASLEQALMLAESCRHDRIAAEAAAALIHALTQQPSEHERALALVQRGDALVRRAGDPPALRGRYWMAVGGLRLQRMEYDESLAAYERSYASLAAALPPEDPDVGIARVNLGSVLRNLERCDEAIAHHREVLETRERTMGPHHPRTVRLLIGLAQDHEVADRPEEAIALYEDAITRAETGLGPTHHDLANALGGFARVARTLERYDESRAAYLRALEIAERRGEMGTADTALLFANLGNLERQTDRLDEARAHIERALELRERIVGPQHYWAGQSRYSLAGVELLAGNYERARVLALDAASILSVARGTHEDELSNAEIRAAVACIELGRIEEARRHLDLAIAASPEEDESYLVARGRVALADADVAGAAVFFGKAVDAAKNAWTRGEALTHLAIAQRRAGEDEAATATFARAREELVAAREAGRHGLRRWTAAQQP
jgi:tetratricopeptide (TPR) repeat protein